MEALQNQIAACFPDAYTESTWKDLLPQFISHQLEFYEKQVDQHEKELALWEAGNRSKPAPTYPVMPVVFAEACELQAQIEGFDFRALACCLYIGRQRNEALQKQYKQLHQLCGEYDEASTEMRNAYLTIHNGTKLGKWLN